MFKNNTELLMLLKKDFFIFKDDWLLCFEVVSERIPKDDCNGVEVLIKAGESESCCYNILRAWHFLTIICKLQILGLMLWEKWHLKDFWETHKLMTNNTSSIKDKGNNEQNNSITVLHDLTHWLFTILEVWNVKEDISKIKLRRFSVFLP